MVTEFLLRFDYGLIVPWVTRMASQGLTGDRRAGHGRCAYERVHKGAR